MSSLTTPVPLRADSSDTLLRAGEIIDIEIKALEGLKDQLDENFPRAVHLLEHCTGRVIVTGMGKSGHIGKKIAATLSSTGTPAFFLHPAEGSHGDLGLMMKDDVVIAISNSGETPEIINLLPPVKRLGLSLIAMTGNLTSTLASRADLVLNIAVKQEACPLGLAPTASTTATLALGDALAIVLLERKGFTEEDFALFHPAGSLGKRLLLTVADLMHTGDTLPVVSIRNSFQEALFEMTSKKLGITLVVDETGYVQGILTDGDVRRALTHHSNIDEITLTDVITPSPKTIGPDALAVSALRIMEDFKITVLLINTPDGKPLGAVHLHDILKTGIT